MDAIDQLRTSLTTLKAACAGNRDPLRGAEIGHYWNVADCVDDALAQADADRAVLLALGFEGERLKLARWAVGNGMRPDQEEDCGDYGWNIADDSRMFAEDGDRSGWDFQIWGDMSGRWYICEKNGFAKRFYKFDKGQHESAWQQFTAAREASDE